MRDDYDDDDQPTREEIAEQYGWREGEREQTQREMDERARALKRDEVLRSCKAHEAERQRPRTPVVERSYGQKKQDAAAAANYWKDYIAQQVESANMALTRAVADAVVTEERRRERANDEMTTRMNEITDRMDEITAWLAELEARMPKRRGAVTPACDATPRGFDVDRLRGEWRH